MTRLLILAAVAVLLSAALPTAAQATHPGGSDEIDHRGFSTEDARRSYYSGDRRLKVLDKTDYGTQVAAAIDAWNRARTGVTLVLTRKRRGAHIVVTQKRVLYHDGEVAGGLGGPGSVQLSTSAFGPADAFRAFQVRIVTHELGHALGLGHTRRTCSIMGHRGDEEDTATCAGNNPPVSTGYHCGPSEENARKVAKIFGAKRAKPRAALECPLPAGYFDAAVEGATTGPAPEQLRIRNTGSQAWGNVSITSFAAGREVGICPQLGPRPLRQGTDGGGELIRPGEVAVITLQRSCYDPERRFDGGPPRYTDLRLIADDLGSAMFGPPMSFSAAAPRQYGPDGG